MSDSPRSLFILGILLKCIAAPQRIFFRICAIWDFEIHKVFLQSQIFTCEKSLAVCLTLHFFEHAFGETMLLLRRCLG